MSVEHILDEIQKRGAKKEELLNRLLDECKEIIEKLSKFKDSPTSFRPKLPNGVIGRRMGDKIFYLEKVVDESSKLEKCFVADIEKLEKALFLVTEHLKNYSSIYQLDEPITLPTVLSDIKNEFIILNSLETNLKNNYIDYCFSELKQMMANATDKMEKLEIKQTFEVYVQLGKSMSYITISRLKALNDEYGSILSPGFIAREYKACNDRLWHYKQDFEVVIQEREKIRESAKHLTHLQKCEAKHKSYADEIAKYYKKMDSMDDDSQSEFQDLINSYEEAQKIMEDEILKIKQFINKEYGFDNVDDYNKKSTELQVKFANYEIETKKLQKRSALLGRVLNDIHSCRQKSGQN